MLYIHLVFQLVIYKKVTNSQAINLGPILQRGVLSGCFYVFLQIFVGFFFFFALLNVEQIKLIGMILVFLWGFGCVCGFVLNHV